MPVHSCETGAACRSTGGHARGIVLSIAVVLLAPVCRSGGGPSELPPDVETPVVQRVASVDVVPASITIRTGDTALLTATPRTASGAPVDEPVVWGSADADLTITPVAGAPNQAQVTSAVGGSTHVSATVETPDGPVSGGATSASTRSAWPRSTFFPPRRPCRPGARCGSRPRRGTRRAATSAWR